MVGVVVVVVVVVATKLASAPIAKSDSTMSVNISVEYGIEPLVALTKSLELTEKNPKCTVVPFV